MLFLIAISQPLRGDSGSLVRYESTAPLMGCTFGIAAYGSDRESLASHVESAFDAAREIESWMSNYQPQSELSRLNRSAAGKPIAVSDDLFDLLTKAARYSRASAGAFDMTVGPLVRAWGFHEGGGHLPEPKDFDEARDRVGYQFVELDPARKTVHFARAGMDVDPGGIGKGYAVDRMVALLRESGIRTALVNACQSSVYGMGAPPDDPHGWALEIDNPNSGAPETIFLKDQALSTSGSQEKFFEANGHVYSHILDPRTGQPAEGVAAVSVIAPTAIDSDVWSTAIFVNGLAWAARNARAALRIYGCPTGKTCRWIERPH